MADNEEVQEEEAPKIPEFDADWEKGFDSEREMVVLGAGAVIESNKVLLTKAFAENDRNMLIQQYLFAEALNKKVQEFRQLACKLYDGKVTGGYESVDWLDGFSRLRKKSAGKVGRKAKPKPDFTKSC